MQLTLQCLGLLTYIRFWYSSIRHSKYCTIWNLPPGIKYTTTSLLTDSELQSTPQHTNKTASKLRHVTPINGFQIKTIFFAKLFIKNMYRYEFAFRFLPSLCKVGQNSLVVFSLYCHHMLRPSRIFSSRRRPGGSPNLLFNGYRGLFPQG
jgi:hypothetical protein